MPYTVFALKWRPQNFDEIVGQKYIVTTLKNALEKNRVAHAYIFAGPRGVGKTSTARILAKALNCKDAPIVNPCGKCSSCIEISQSRSLDVIEIDGASNRGIDEIRTLRENVKFAPAQGKFKIYIIDEVHMLTTEAFNALLKTLEEPPESVKFIFATTQPHKVIPTILSRCHRLDFRRISAMEIVAQLEKIVQAEQINIDKDVLFAIAKSSDGSLRDAESVLDQLVSFSQDKISLKDIVSVLGLVEQEALFEITDKIAQKDAKEVLGLLNKIIDEGKDPHVFLTNLIEHFRNLMIVKVMQADYKLIDLPTESCERLLKQAQAFSLEEILSAFNILINAQEMSKRLESLRIPLEISLVKLVQGKKGTGPSSPISEKTQESKHSTTKDDTSTNPAQNISLENIKDAWQNILERLRTVKMSVATYLYDGMPIKLENNLLTVAFPKDYLLHKESLERKENKAIIEKLISEIFNTNLRINFILSPDVVKENEEENPLIKTALNTFSGRVIKEE